MTTESSKRNKQLHRIVRTVRPFVDALFPRICQICDTVLLDPNFESICQECLLSFAPDENRCQRCSAPVPRSVAVTPKKCHLCKKTWHFQRALCLCTYRAAAAKAARRMKSANHEPLTAEIGVHLGKWLNETVNIVHYDALIPIPQHWYRRATLRYNQAEVLARMIATECDIAVREDLLKRTRLTAKQGTKTIQERQLSLVDSFACTKPDFVQYKSFLLVDDIVTSGATASEAAKPLMDAGAKRVDIVAFARGASVGK